jgi:hypothetical protein
MTLSGFDLYGFDQNDRWQWAGWFVLFLSPIGLPMVFGAPVIFILQTVIAIWKARNTN